MAVATTINRQLPACHEPRQATGTARLLVALGLVVSFSYVGHALIASKELAERSLLNPNRLENRFAVRVSSTQTNSVIGFNLMGAVGALCWMSADRRRLRVNWWLLLCGAAYAGWCFASILWSIEPALSLRKEGILVLMLITAYGLAARFELEDLLWIAMITLAIFIGVGILAELYYGTLRPWRPSYRFSGTVDPNDQGLQCALLVLAAMLAQWPERWGQRQWPWLRAGLVTIGLGGLWLSKSRTTLAAFLVAATLALVLRARGAHRWMVLGGCLMVGCLGGIAYTFVSVSVIGETTDVAAMGREKDLNTLTGRLPLWEEAWKAAQRHPWAGHGFGAYWNAKNVLAYSDQFSWHIPHAHNAYIDLALAVGGVGVTLYVLWVSSSAVVAFARYEWSGRPAELFAACILIFSLVHGAAESKIPGAGIGGITCLTAMAMLTIRRPMVQPAMLQVEASRPSGPNSPRFRSRLTEGRFTVQPRFGAAALRRR